MNRKVTVAGEEFSVYTETRPSGCLAVVFERGVQGTAGYYQESVPVRKYQTVEQVYSKMYNQRISAAEHAKWRNSIAAIPNEERHLHPSFAYFRHKQYGVAMYFRSKWSPTGVENMGGYSEEEFYKLGLDKFGVAERNDF